MNRPLAHACAGFGAIAAIFVLVVLASLAAAIVRIGQAAQTGSAQDILGARAWAAARAGTEWGLYQALKGGWSTCSGASQTLDLTADTGFRVTVRCSSQVHNEGEDASGAVQTVRFYEREGLLAEPEREPSGNQRYAKRHLQRGHSAD